ncbi:hypothetical protein CRUP_025820 [Coryphaenoides rupestris]|nr:hypothetical protein CRUP_025820 [Coryphaenoides rupestris]
MPSLIEHMDGHVREEEERKYKCDECGRGYRHAGSLANHKKTHEVGSFECQICGKENSNALALKSHLRSHTSQKKYSCEDCGKAFRLASQLATHERVHLSKQHGKEQSFRAVDDEYGESENRDEMREDDQRLLYERSAAGGLSMDNSPAEEDEAGPLDHAETSEDTGTRPYKCDLCDKSYIHFRSLTNHKKTHQTGMFECTVCFKLFNNMAALYSHHRTHRSRDGEEPDAAGECSSTPQHSQFSPQNQDTAVNFCHLCQVLFSTDDEFQEHIQMHNSSSGSYGAHGDHHNVSYENSIHSPESNFYASPVNNIPSVSSSADNHRDYDHSSERALRNGQMFPDCSTSQPSLVDPQGEQVLDDNDEVDDGSDPAERRFKCEVCGKRYRHSGSLINHRRSHQVGIYQCSICRKSYPHLAALKSHLRLHKAQPSSFSLNAEGDWLSSEPLTLESQHGGFPSQEEEEEGGGGDSDAALVAGDHGDAASSYHERFDRGFPPQGRTVHLPQDEHLMQRHQCADCGETFADIAGIKSHACPLHRRRHPAAGYSRGGLDFGECSDGVEHGVRNPVDGMDFPPGAMNGNHHDQSYFSEEDFHEHASGDRLSGGGGDEADEEDEDDDDGELYQCSVCGNRYTSMRALRSHLRGHTQAHGTPASSGPSSMSSSHEELKDEESGETLVMICSTCGESFSRRQDLIAHQLSHAGAPQMETETDAGHPHTLINNNNVNNHHDDNSEADTKQESQSVICGRCGMFCGSYEHLRNHGCEAGGREEPSDRGGGGEEEEVRRANHPPAPSCEEKVVVEEEQQRAPRRTQGMVDAGADRQYRHACHECGKAFKIQKQLLNHLRRHKENQAKIQELNTQIQALMQLNGPDGASAGPQQQQRRNARRRPPPGSVRRRRPPAASRDPVAKPGGGVKSENDAGDLRPFSPGGGVKSENDAGDLRPFSCDQCGRTYRHAGSLVNHRNSHKTGEYCCSVCSNTYPNQLAMKNHLRTHFAYKKHACQSCGKGFRGKKMLLNHVCGGHRRKDGARGVRRALKIRGHRCDLCGRSYRHAGSLLNHKKTHSEDLHHCTIPRGYGGPRPQGHYYPHQQQQQGADGPTNGSRYWNPGMDQSLDGMPKLIPPLSHMDAGVPDPEEDDEEEEGEGGGGDVPGGGGGEKSHVCDHCGRAYRHAGSLLNHKNSHKTGSFFCGVCQKEFSNLMALKNHRRIHTEPKRYQCLECGKAFRVSTQLICHRRIHTKEKPFGCLLCDKSFSSKSNLRHHQKLHQNAPAYDAFGMDANSFMDLDMGSFL